MTPVIAVMNPVPPIPRGRANKQATVKFGANGKMRHATDNTMLPIVNRRTVITRYRAFEMAPTTLPILVTVNKMAYPLGSCHNLSLIFGSTVL